MTIGTPTTKNDTLTYQNGDTAIDGLAGTDTLLFAQTDATLTTTALTSIEILKAGVATATTFKVDQSDLAAKGSVIGSTGADTLTIVGTTFDLRSTTLTSVENLVADATLGTASATFIVDQADLANGVSVVGATQGADKLIINGATLDLTSATLSDVESLIAGTAKATTFIIDTADLADITAITGSTGADTLSVKGGTGDFSAIDLISIETLKTAQTGATAFTVNAVELKANGGAIATITGSAATGQTDSLTVLGTAFDLRSTTVTNIEALIAGNNGTNSTTFNLDQADIAKNGAITGSSNALDKLFINGASLDLTSTTLSAIEFLGAGTSKATSFILDQADLTNVLGISGSSGADTLTVKGNLDFGTRDLDSIETLKAGASTATAFTVQEGDLKANGGAVATITGSTGIDSLTVKGNDFNLASTVVTNIEQLVGDSVSTTFTLDQADIAKNGSITGSTDTGDQLIINGATLDLTSTVTTGVEGLVAGTSKATTFTVDAADLAAVTSITGSAGVDSLIVKTGTTVNLGGADLDSVEILKVLDVNGVDITVKDADLAGTGGDITQIVGAKGIDSLTVIGTDFDLTGTTLSSIESLVGDAAATSGVVFRVDQADLAKGGSINGTTNSDDELIANGSSLDLTSTTVTSVENLSGSGNNLFTITDTQLGDLSKIEDGSGGGTLVVKGTAVDVSGLTTLDGIATLKAGAAGATKFTVDESQLGFNGSDALATIVGSSGSDALQVVGTNFNLDGTTLSSVEQLVASDNGTDGTVFTLAQVDLAKGGSIVGSSSVQDMIAVNGNALDLSSTTVTDVEHLQGLDTVGTTFTLTGTQFAAFGDIDGDGSDDVLVVKSTDFNLALGADISNIEAIKAGLAGATTFVVDKTDLVSGGGEVATVIGSSGADTLTVKGTDFDLKGVTLNSIEKLVADTGLGPVTFTLENTLLDTKTTIIGTSNTTDSIVAANSTLDLRSTTLSSVEELKASLSTGTEFTITSAQLGGLKISGHTSGADTLKISSNNYDLSSVALSSIEILAGSVASTTFKLNQGDLASGGSVTGFTTGTDTIIAVDTELNLSSTTLTSIEKLQAGNTDPTTFTVNQGDLATKGSVLGNKGSDTLVTADTVLNLTSTTVSSIEILKAGNVAATTFTVDQADLAKGGSVIGSTGTDTLVVLGNAIDLTSTGLSSVEILTGSSSKAMTFTLDTADLTSLQSITGNTGTVNTLVVKGTLIDLGGTTVSNIEALKASATADTTIILQGDGGFSSITGTAKVDTLQTSTTELDLTGTTLSGIEILKAGNVAATTFTVDQADLAKGGSVIGSTGTDTLQTVATSINLTSTALTNVEKLITSNSSGTTFTVDAADLAVLTAVTGSNGSDTLTVTDTSFDLSSTAVTFIETLKAGSAKNTTFIVDQADLVSGGSVVGSSGSDTLKAAGTALDLTSTTLSSVEVLAAASGGTAFTVDAADLAGKIAVQGGAGVDSLTILGTSFDVTSSTLTSVDKLIAGSASATTFRVDQEDLAANGSVIGSTVNDTLIANGTALNLSSTTLTSIEILQAGSSKGTSFTVDQGDLSNGGSVNGSSSGIDALVSANTAIDLTSTTLSSIEVLATAATGSNGTTFTVDANDLASGGSVNGNANAADDTLVVKDTVFNLTSTALSSIEVLKAGLSTATTFTVDKADLAAGGQVIGSTGVDTLAINGSLLDLTSTTLTSVEVLKTALSGTVGTTFIIDQADLASAGSVVGSSIASDTLQISGTLLDLSNTTLSDIDTLKAGNTASTTFKLDATDIADVTAIIGSTSGADTVLATQTSLDLSGATLTGIEIVTGTTNATIYRLSGANIDQLSANAGAAITGAGAGVNKLEITSGDANLSKIAVTGIKEYLYDDGLTLTVDQADLAGTQSITGSGDVDVLAAAGSELDLSGITLTGIEGLEGSAHTLGTLFTLTDTQLTDLESIQAQSTKLDVLKVTTTNFDLTSVTLEGVETLQAGNTGSTTFKVDGDDLADVTNINGSTSSGDTLMTIDTVLDLTGITLSGVEFLKAGNVAATTFKVDQDDLSAGVSGSSGNDTLAINGTSLDLSGTTLTSVETLSTLATGTLGTIFTVDKADLASNGSVLGNSTAIDTLVVNGTDFDVSGTMLSSIEILKTIVSGGTTFKVDQADLASGGSVIGHTGGTDILLAAGTSLDLSSTSLTSIETLKAVLSTNTTFTVDQADLAANGSVIGHTSGTDTLLTHATGLDLSSTTLTSIEHLTSDNSSGTTFTVDLNDIATGATVSGSGGIDTLVVIGTNVDLTSTTLSSIEHLTGSTTGDTTFTLDQSDLTSMGGSGLISGHTTANDTLVIDGTTNVNLASTTLFSIETIETSDQTVATHFTVGNGQAGSTIALTANTVDDTISFASGYKLGTSGIADQDAVAAHAVAISGFEAGASSDVLDLSSIVTGTPTRVDISGYIDLTHPATLKDALDIAAASNTAASNSSVVTFEFSGDTYVLIDHSNDTKLSADDTVIKLVGVTTPLDNSNITF